MRRLTHPGFGVLAVVAVAASLTACGSSASHPAAANTHSVQQGLLTGGGNPDVGIAPAQVSPSQNRALGAPRSRPARRPPAIQRAGNVQRARLTPSSSTDDVSTGTTTLDPCSLVTRSEVESAAGATLSAGVEAPLGPSCIFKRGGRAPDIALAVVPLSFAEARHSLPRPEAVTVGAHTAYCGGPAHAVLLVSVAPGRVLSVSAPCSVARRIAAIAIGRLSA